MKISEKISAKWFVYGIALVTISSALLSVSEWSPIASAAELRGGDHYGIGTSSTTRGDFYFAGESLLIAGTTTGDMIAVAARANLSGTTTGDVFFAGGELYLAGDTEGDVRVLAGLLEHEGHAHEDMVVAAGQVHIAQGSLLDGDLVVYAERLVIEGTVQGNVEAHVQSAELRGTIVGTADIQAGVSLAVLDGAKLGGLTYSAPRAAVLDESAAIKGEVNFTPRVREQGANQTIMRLVFELVLVLVCVGFVYFLAPRAAERVVAQAFATSGRSILIGVAVLIGWPLFCVALAVTLFGVPLALFGVFLYVLGILLALAYTPVVAGASVARAMRRDDLAPVWQIVLGGVVLVFLELLWFVGWAVRFILFLLVLGVLAQEAVRHIRALRQQPVAAPPTDTGISVVPDHGETA